MFGGMFGGVVRMFWGMIGGVWEMFAKGAGRMFGGCLGDA